MQEIGINVKKKNTRGFNYKNRQNNKVKDMKKSDLNITYLPMIPPINLTENGQTGLVGK